VVLVSSPWSSQLRVLAGVVRFNRRAALAADPGRVSRYEAGPITPSAEALVRLAETLNISIDHLLVDGIPRRPLHSAQDTLGDRLAALPPDDLASLLNIIDGLVAKNRLKTLAGGLS
jgi:transcriptional regulator with XRE-family HTH domain